jgi:DNA-3-methyladenine glycosylase II
MSAALQHLSAACPKLKGLIRRVGPCRLEIDRQSPYESLVRSIAHQQLHGAAARTITARFIALFPDSPFPTPEQVLAADLPTLRGCGFSGAKVAAIRDIALKTTEGVVPSRRAAHRLSDAALIERLTTIRGVGRWTVEMVLMFSLGRPDLLPVDDFGVREGYRILHGLDSQPKPKVLAELGQAYAPHRSTAAWYLWRAVDEAKAIRMDTDRKINASPRS